MQHTIKPSYSKKHPAEHKRCVTLHKDVKKAFDKLCVKKLTTVNPCTKSIRNF